MTNLSFNHVEELLSGKSNLVPLETEQEANNVGPTLLKKTFTFYAVRDSRLITGQNPMSGRAVATLLVASFGKS